jgi:hypothetical protein
MERSERVIVKRRFCGPPGTGNGGYVAGIVAEGLGRCEVTLRRPAPLEAPLALHTGSDGRRLEAEAEGVLLAEARVVEARLPIAPAAPHFEQAVRAGERALPRHPFPHCFVCGPGRTEGDGLRIFAGPLEPGCWDVVAAPWLPDASLCADGERVDAPFLWSALDCPGGMVAMGGEPRPVLLARMTAELSGGVRCGERCVVVAWRIARDGRKHGCATALYGEDGALRGASEQLWIEPRSAGAA